MKKALTDLEADPEWAKLLDEDRVEIAAKLTCEMPETAQDGDPVRLLQTILVRKRTLPALFEELRGEVKRKIPAESKTRVIEENMGAFREEVLDADALLQPVVIATPEDLESWLAALREKLTDLLKSNKRIRIKGRE